MRVGRYIPCIISKGGVWSQVIGGLVLKQHAKKVMSDSLGLVDFAIGLVNSEGKVKFFGKFK